MLTKIRKKLAKENLDAISITNLINIRYLTGFTGTSASLIITKKKAWFCTDGRYLEYVKKILPKNFILIDIQKISGKKREKFLLKNKIKHLGFESESVSVERYTTSKKLLKKIHLKPAKNTVEEVRITKTKNEIKNIIQAQRIAEKVLNEIIKKYLKPYFRSGITEKQIAWEIERLGHEFGADTISFSPIVGFGPNSAVPHHQNTDKKFKKGDIILIDMGMKYQGYCSDMTRTFFTAPPTPLQKKVYEIVLEAQEKGIHAMKPEITGEKIDKIAREHIKKAGFEKNFTHSYGHGIGLEVHEVPTLSAKAKNTLPQNTIVTAEPGIYLEGKFGVRIEDMCLIEKSGTKNLTNFPKKLSHIIL